MEGPRLVRARPRELLERPHAPIHQASYAVVYAIGLPGSACPLQRVETRVRFLRGERVLASYRSIYWEFFRGGSDPEEQRHDVHDFDVERDGWGSGPISRLLKRHSVEASGGLARLECEKRFLLGPGEVSADEPTHFTASGGAFGYLDEVEGERGSRSLLLDGEAKDVSDVARPLPRPIAGRGRFTGPERWEASERLWFELATLTGEVEIVPYRPLV